MVSRFVQENDGLAVPLPITQAAHTTASRFAQAQIDSAKAATVRLNTLAVEAVNSYCQMMGIPADLAGSDSWNPLLQTVSNVADLVLPGIGRLECRPVQPDQTACYVPPEVWDLRVGYVVVAIDEAASTARLLGFVPAIATEELPLAQLQPMETCLDHLYALQQQSDLNFSSSLNLAAENLSAAAVNLRQWLSASFEAGWLAVDDLLAPGGLSPAMDFRGVLENPVEAPTMAGEANTITVRRAKLVHLVLPVVTQQVVLVVEMQTTALQPSEIGVRVYPASGKPYLPADLELAILEPGGEVFLQAQSRQADS
ncbi:hypothetical protein C7271_22055, partial [filamentous cyanobacterium CCP5]